MRALPAVIQPARLTVSAVAEKAVAGAPDAVQAEVVGDFEETREVGWTVSRPGG